jgi:hypothetical protein
MGLLNTILERPAFERPFLIPVVGYPVAGAAVPQIAQESLEEFAVFI